MRTRSEHKDGATSTTARRSQGRGRRMLAVTAASAMMAVGGAALATPSQAAICGFDANVSGDDMVYTFKNCHTRSVGLKVDIIFATDEHPVLGAGRTYTKRVPIGDVNQVRSITIITYY